MILSLLFTLVFFLITRKERMETPTSDSKLPLTRNIAREQIVYPKKGQKGS